MFPKHIYLLSPVQKKSPTSKDLDKNSFLILFKSKNIETNISLYVNEKVNCDYIYWLEYSPNNGINFNDKKGDMIIKKHNIQNYVNLMGT